MDAQRLTNGAYINVNAAKPQTAAAQGAAGNTAAKDFRQVLSSAVDSSERLRFSKHAGARVLSREVELTPEQLERVEDGISQAREKGVTDSLVLVDGYALVVNTRSRTVITAMDSRRNDAGSVFTNINGAVIV